MPMQESTWWRVCLIAGVWVLAVTGCGSGAFVPEGRLTLEVAVPDAAAAPASMPVVLQALPQGAAPAFERRVAVPVTDRPRLQSAPLALTVPAQTYVARMASNQAVGSAGMITAQVRVREHGLARLRVYQPAAAEGTPLHGIAVQQPARRLRFAYPVTLTATLAAVPMTARIEARCESGDHGRVLREVDPVTRENSAYVTQAITWVTPGLPGDCRIAVVGPDGDAHAVTLNVGGGAIRRGRAIEVLRVVDVDRDRTCTATRDAPTQTCGALPSGTAVQFRAQVRQPALPGLEQPDLGYAWSWSCWTADGGSVQLDAALTTRPRWTPVENNIPPTLNGNEVTGCRIDARADLLFARGYDVVGFDRWTTTFAVDAMFR